MVLVANAARVLSISATILLALKLALTLALLLLDDIRHVLGRALDAVSAPVLMRRAIRRAEDGLFTHYMYFTAATVNTVPEVLLVEEQSVVAR